LRAALEKAGLSVFKDDDSLRGGDRWLERLQQVLQRLFGLRRAGRARRRAALGRRRSAGRADPAPVGREGRRPPADLPDPARRRAPETLPPFLALFQASRWTATEALPAGLIDAIRAHAIRLDSPPAIEGCPFVGLNAFTSKDARLFFGRRGKPSKR
jgi:hypothetical protein